jgi:hypothetical protein
MQALRRVAAITRNTGIKMTGIAFLAIHEADHGGIIRLTFTA